MKVSQVQPVRSRSTAKKWKLTIPTGRPVVFVSESVATVNVLR